MVWVGFIAFVLLMLALDLGVFHRKAHVVSVKEAVGWSLVWLTLGLSFSVFVYFAYELQWFGLGQAVDAADGLLIDGGTAVEKYLTGYVIEKSLSVDNIFVIAMIFSYLKIPSHYQYRVLFWGIVGAIVLRGLMIIAGAALLRQFDWMFYVFGAILLVTGI
jgi:tellurite resistance protein TerC